MFILVILLILLAVTDCILAIRFIYALYTCPDSTIQDQDCPSVAVVLCLRGVDPSLESCLHAILNQDYPRYYLHIVIDNKNDPAWSILEKIMSQNNQVQIRTEILEHIQPHCSLKCSSQIQALNNLNPDVKIVAFLDADTISHQYWLRTLVAPLSDPDTGATTGVRWYIPNHSTWGSDIRYAWNAAAQTQMFANNIAWGGSLAIKRDVIEKTNLPECWKYSFCEDTSLNTALEKHGLKIKIIPSLVMVNNEQSNIKSFLRFMQRQLILVRLHHNKWSFVVTHGVTLLTVILGSLYIFSSALPAGDFGSACLLAISLISYQLMLLVLLLTGEFIIRAKIKNHIAPGKWFTPGILARLIVSIPLAQIFYSLTLISAIFAREVEWRGIRYLIKEKNRIDLVQYKPYQASAINSNNSI